MAKTIKKIVRGIQKGAVTHHQDQLIFPRSFKVTKTAYNRQSRKLDEVLLTGVVLNKVAQMKDKGEPLDDSVIESIVRRVVNERAGKE